MAGLLRPTHKGHLTQRFGGTPVDLEPTGWFVERKAGRALRTFSGPFDGGTSRPFVHPGIDISLARGTRLRAVESGKIVKVGTYPSTRENYLRLRIRPGVFAFYTHLREATREQGERVARGEVIARSGNSGISTGPHLHFEIRRKLGDRLFRYNPRRLFEGGDLADEPWILPDQPPPAPKPAEDDMPQLITDLPGRVVTLKSGAVVRAAPSPDAAFVRQVAEPEREDAIGRVQGGPHAGSTGWLMWSAGTAFEYAHESDVEVLPAAPLGDCSEAVTQAVTAALAAASRGTPPARGPDPVEDDEDEPDDDVL